MALHEIYIYLHLDGGNQSATGGRHMYELLFMSKKL
jgi:hypothetical protein